MNAKEVLNKIATALSLVKEEVAFTQAQSADGTILDSKTFDVNEDINMVSEDGTVSPAKDGEYEVVLKDAEGKDVRIKVMVKDGKIAERENVELPQGDTEMDSMAGDDISTPETPDASTEEPQAIPQTMESLSYRIEELEKKMAEMVAVKEDITDTTKKADTVEVGENSSMMSAVDGGEDDSEETSDEEELPKLDGAPVEEEATKLSNTKFGKKVGNSQNTFLSKLYK